MIRRFTCISGFFLLCTVATHAAAQRDIAFESYAVPASGTVVVAVAKGVPDQEGAFAAVDQATQGALRRAVQAADFKAGKDAKLALPGLAPYDQVLLVGLGDKATDTRALEDFGGTVAQHFAKRGPDRVEVLWSGSEADAGASIAFGAALGQYSFDLYRSAKSEDDTAGPSGKGRLVIRSPAGAGAAAVYDRQWRPVADAVRYTRDLITEPANVVWPEVFVERTRQAFAGLPNIRFEVLDVPAMQRLGMGGILAVGQGSVRPPRLLVVRYDGGRAGEAPLAFVGKGITFDSGGISIKSNDGMWRMKTDMSGAASATGAVLALAGRRAPVNVIGVAALAENMPSGTAGRPGDVVRTMSGKTFEVMSTDAEGRMVLTDAVWYAQQQYKPRLLIDIATLTGAIVGALGDEYAGLFSRDDALADQLLAAGKTSGEELWRMPLHPSYAEDLKSPIADLRNGGGRTGAGTGAHFIGEWIQKDLPWAHLDIAGMAWRESGLPTSPAGASAFGVRLFDRLVRDHYE